MQDSLEIEVLVHGIAGNPHAMDAVLRLPPNKLRGSLLKTREALGIVFQPHLNALSPYISH